MSDNFWIAVLVVIFLTVLVFVPFQLGDDPSVFQHWQEVGAKQAAVEVGITGLYLLVGLFLVGITILTISGAGAFIRTGRFKNKENDE